jgi:hypothetical protein
MHVRFLVMLLAVALLTVTAIADAAKDTFVPLENVPLLWKPKEKLGKADVPATPIQIEIFQDARENRSAIGANLEKATPKPVTTNENVAAFVTTHLREVLQGGGANTVDSGGAVTITGRITQFFCKETSHYNSELTVQMSAVARDGRTLWSGTLTGTASHFGRSYKLDNYYEALSDAVVAVAVEMLRTPGLHAALVPHPPESVAQRSGAFAAQSATSQSSPSASSHPPPPAASRPATPRPVQSTPRPVQPATPRPQPPAAEVAPAVAAVPAPAPQGPAERRVALVVGNSAYDSGALSNPINDARLLRDTLKADGFEVLYFENADRRQMVGAIEMLGEKLTAAGGNGVGMFYFSGHGVQSRDGHNFLLPVRGNIRGEADLLPEAVDAQWVLKQMEQAGNRLDIMVLDACRNNPLPATTRSLGKGLASMTGPPHSVLAFSTDSGSVAYDGKVGSRNSPYAEALARYMRQPGLEMQTMFSEVARSVYEATKSESAPQIPVQTYKLTPVFYFRPQQAVAMGRIYFYRPNIYIGSLMRPAIALNEQGVGSSVSGEFFYVDRAPGKYEVALVAETGTGRTTRKLSFTLDPGQNRYIKVGIGQDVAFTPELVDAGLGKQEVAGLKQSPQPAAK